MTERGPLVMLLVVAAALAAYATSLPGKFQYDDLPTIVENEAVRDLGNVPSYFTDPDLFTSIPGNAMYRPVLLATYAVDYQLSGYRPFLWTLTNVLLHALNALLVAILAGRLLLLLRPGKPPGYAPLLAGLVFALHPIQSEVVNYVSSRSGAIATLGFLAALLLHLAWTRRPTRTPLRAMALAGSVLFFAFGLGGKEIAIALVPTVVVLELLDPSRRSRKHRLAYALLRPLPVVLVAAFYLVLRDQLLNENLTAGVTGRFFEVAGRPDPLSGGGRSVLENLLTQSRVFWMYLGLLLVPVGLAVDHFVRVSSTLGEPPVLASLFGIALLLGLLVWSSRKNPFVTFCGALFFFALAPTSSLIPLNVIMNEHRLYLPLVGFALLAGHAVGAAWRRWPKAVPALAGAVAVCWIVVLVPRNLLWQNPALLWADNVRVAPDSFRAHNQLGAAIYERAARYGSSPEALPHIQAAIEEYEKAEALYPDWFHVQLNLGIAWRERARITKEDADFEEAIRHFEHCAEVSRNTWRARYQIATTYGVWKKYEEAIRRFSEMADEDRKSDGPRLQLYLFPLARLNAERGELVRSEALYREIVEAYPDDIEGCAGLAKVLAERGKKKEAGTMMNDLARTHGSNPRVFILFADYLLDLEPPEPRAAAGLFRKAVSLGYRPNDKELARYPER